MVPLELAKWFAAIKRYDGKPVDDFVVAMNKKPPVLTKSGNAESPMGWLRYFERQEARQIS